MQIINKEASSRTFTHTWYLYPISVILIVFLWIWGFQAFHQPSAHQRINIFIGASVKNSTFTKVIQKNYEREKLREISINYALPSEALYRTKLELHQTQSDILVLPKITVNEYKEYYSNYFIEYDAKTKENYFQTSYQYYGFEGHDIGILFKNKGEDNQYNKYMTFYDDDYYLLITKASTNTGTIFNDKNGEFDNALTIVKYLLGDLNG